MYLVTDKYGRQLFQVQSFDKAIELSPPKCRVYKITGLYTCELVQYKSNEKEQLSVDIK